MHLSRCDVQIAPSYNAEWGYRNGAQNDIFVPASESSNAAPTGAVQNRVVVVDASSNQTTTMAVEDLHNSSGGGKKVVTQVVTATRVHYATVTAQAANLKMEQQQRKKRALLEMEDPVVPGMQKMKRMKTHVRKASSPHRRL